MCGVFTLVYTTFCQIVLDFPTLESRHEMTAERSSQQVKHGASPNTNYCS